MIRNSNMLNKEVQKKMTKLFLNMLKIKRNLKVWALKVNLNLEKQISRMKTNKYIEIFTIKQILIKFLINT